MKRTQQVMPKPARGHQRRDGSLTLQVVFSLLILLIATIAIIQLGFLLTVRQAVYHAATVGAREAAKATDLSATERMDMVECVVNSILRTHTLSIGDCAGVTLENPALDAPDDVIHRGWTACTAPATPVLTSTDDGNKVRVTVCVDLAKLPLGNTLSAVGICPTDMGFRASSVTVKEVPPQ